MLSRKDKKMLQKGLTIFVLIIVMLGEAVSFNHNVTVEEALENTNTDQAIRDCDMNTSNENVVKSYNNVIGRNPLDNHTNPLWKDKKATLMITNALNEERKGISGKELLDLFYLLPLLEKVTDYGRVVITIIGDQPILFNSSVEIINSFTQDSNVTGFSRTDLFVALLSLMLGTEDVGKFGFVLKVINVGDLPLFSQETLLSAIEYAIGVPGDIIVSMFAITRNIPRTMAQLLDSANKLLLLPELWPESILGKPAIMHAWNILKVGGIPFPTTISPRFTTVGLTTSTSSSFSSDIVVPDITPADFFGNREIIANKENSIELLKFIGNSTMSGSLVPTIYTGIGLGLVASIVSASEKNVNMAKLRLATMNSSRPTYLELSEDRWVELGYGIPDFWGTLETYSQFATITTSRFISMQGIWIESQNRSVDPTRAGKTTTIPIGKWSQIFFWVDIWKNSLPVIPYNTENRISMLSVDSNLNFEVGSNSGTFLFNISMIWNDTLENLKESKKTSLNIKVIKGKETLVLKFLQVEVMIPKAYGALVNENAEQVESPFLDYNEFRLSVISQNVWVDDVDAQNMTLQELLRYDFLILTNDSMQLLYDEINTFTSLGGNVLLIPPRNTNIRRTWFQELSMTFSFQNVELSPRNTLYGEKHTPLASLYFPISKFSYPSNVSRINAKLQFFKAQIERNDTRIVGNVSEEGVFFAENILFQDIEVNSQKGLHNYSLVDVYERHKIYSLILAKKMNKGMVVVLASPLLLNSIIAQWYGEVRAYYRLWVYLSNLLSTPNWKPDKTISKSVDEVAVSLKTPNATEWNLLGTFVTDIEQYITITFLEYPRNVKNLSYQVDKKRNELVIKMSHLLGNRFDMKFLVKVPGLTTMLVELSIDHTFSAYGRENWKGVALTVLFATIVLTRIFRMSDRKRKKRIRRASIVLYFKRKPLCPNCGLDTFNTEIQLCSWCGYNSKA